MRGKDSAAGPSISLFPFLAVLLCTMGALIVVLVVLNRQSRLQAAALSDAETASRRKAIEEASADAALRRDELAWELGHLRDSRDKTQTDLDHERLRLSGIEEHRRQLENRLRQIQENTNLLHGGAAGAIVTSPEAELTEIRSAINVAREKLEQLKNRVASQPPTYSVVPYDGPNPTPRRPIFIECTGDRVIIQPEEIVLTASDFNGPPGPGNPLASAIRAARDRLVESAPDPRSPDAEPYPLFLVRPDGVEAYYAARAAMQSWGSDFGYQTIDGDWKLEYPPADTRLAELERRAVEEARERLAWLARFSPDRYGPGGDARGTGNRAAYRVSPLGGLVREEGPSLRDSSRGGALGRDGENSGFGKANQRGPRSGATSSKTRFAGESHGESRARQHPAANGSLESADKSTTKNGTQQAHLPRASERRYGDLNDRGSHTGKAETSTAVNAEGSSNTDPETGQTEINVNVATKPKNKPRSLADTRGVNWGLPPAARASNPITRPIHIQCEGDKLLLRPERSSDPPVVVLLRLRTEDSVDPLVEAIQARIRDWGIAGRGVYWRPQLVLEVGRSGEGRFADLEALLADSGFDVKRRE